MKDKSNPDTAERSQEVSRREFCSQSGAGAAALMMQAANSAGAIQGRPEAGKGPVRNLWVIPHNGLSAAYSMIVQCLQGLTADHLLTMLRANFGKSHAAS